MAGKGKPGRPKGKLVKSERGLTMQQERFIQEYFKDFSGKAAAIRAGYSELYASNSVGKLLSMPLVQQRMEQIRNNIQVDTFAAIKVVLVKFEEIREMAMTNKPVRFRDGEVGYDVNLTAAVAANREIAKILGAYEKDNAQKQVNLPAPQINIINTAPRRANSEDEIED